jgi:hypothetical protein
MLAVKDVECAQHVGDSSEPLGVGVVDDCYWLAEMWCDAAAYPIPCALHVGGVNK